MFSLNRYLGGQEPDSNHTTHITHHKSQVRTGPGGQKNLELLWPLCDLLDADLALTIYKAFV